MQTHQSAVINKKTQTSAKHQQVRSRWCRLGHKYLFCAIYSDGYVKLTGCAESRTLTSTNNDQCVKLTCEGSASPHKRVIWYRLANNSDNSSGLPIAGYWSERYYYETTRSATSKDQISSTLIIQKFNSGYVGDYYCVLYNGEVSIRSPTATLKLSKCTFTHNW